ncbi:MAG: OsmC family protein [Sedimentisphaerales bacterium]|nr:OsmC family protein [Sedimentisphaerales bacterium]
MEVFTNIVSKREDNPAMTAMSGAREAEVGPPAVYGGNELTLNPEEMFVASINSCIMLVFYHFARKLKVGILSYSANAEGKVEKTKNGLRFTGVDVRAEISLVDNNQAERIEEIAQLAEKYCLVSGSVACPVEYGVTVVGEEAEDAGRTVSE